MFGGLLHIQIENILRQDLAGRFHQCQQAMYSALAERERKAPQMYNLKTQVAFHGTLTKSLPSIGVCVGRGGEDQYYELRVRVHLFRDVDPAEIQLVKNVMGLSPT